MLSIQNRFLFIHVPKTGGNSLQNVLREYSEDIIITNESYQDGVERFEVRNNTLRIKKHSTLVEYKSQLPRKIYNSLFKFATVRNPWDMMISHYFSPHRNTSEWNREDFVQLLHITPTLRSYIGLQSLVQKAFSIPGFKTNLAQAPLTAHLDFLIRYENLEQDFKTVCQKISIPPQPLPVRNQSTRDHYSCYYDPELTELVREKFKEEISLGSYTFEQA